ncbi:MAG: response regulator [Melioribacteraceae bacterium]|nr:response regulator [Melioribacteraceae bacterium]
MGEENIFAGSGSEDELIFAEEDQLAADSYEHEQSWKILIVDDEKDVHTVTKLVLDDVVFQNKKFDFISAYSGSEAREILLHNNNIALILLDVVMETESSGLELVKYIRDELNDKDIRIILRTGYPGQAPEKQIIIDYDINDYKEKTELSSQKLLTAVISALRSYNDIITISVLNRTLEKKVEERTKELIKANDSLNESMDKIEKDLEAGRKIQTKFLPKNNIVINGYNFEHALYPSLILSGDFVDYFRIDNRYTGFYFADVSGHGASSAFVTVLIKRFIDDFCEKFHLENDRTVLSPASVLISLNKELLEINLEKYTTMFFGVIDSKEDKLIYSNGGQFPYPYCSCGKECRVLEKSSTPVGLFKFSKYEDSELDLCGDLSIYFFSDGVLEILPQEDLRDKQKFLKELLISGKSDINSLISELELKENADFPDDITIMKIYKVK